MLASPRLLCILSFALLTGALGCHAQAVNGPGAPVSPEVGWKIETMLRSNAQLPADAEIHLGPRSASEVPGYDKVQVSLTVDGKTSPGATFLISTDNKTLAQFNKFDISPDPRQKVSDAGRPGRGGPESAPVLIVSFDDLECPFCGRLHTQLFPAMLQCYGNSIHVAYLDFPESQHPWAMRAAVDVNCLAAQSTQGYWNLVDSLHAHASEIWDGDPKKLAKTNEDLDRLTREEGKREKADEARLDACIAKQGTTSIDASLKRGEDLGVNSTPTLFINGDKIVGAVAPEFIYKVIDNALIAAGKTPPQPAAATPVASAAKGAGR